MKKTNKLITAIVTITGAILLSSYSSGGVFDPPTKIELVFVDHLKAGLIEQDVFVEKKAGSGQVYRVLPSEREKYLSAKIYTIAQAEHHDPFDPKNAGPYKKGKSLGMTLADWLKGKGTATISCEEGWSTFTAEFENLVPNATYTMWHFFMPAPPTVPFTGTLDVPLGDRKGAQSVFKTDNKGNASLDVTFEHCLQMSGDQLMSGMAIALHTDGKTYGPDPGAFGKDTHVQLFAMFPDEDDVN
ncbi:MAG: hypothetical protein AAF717_12435 [Bacteroidota bacterium]